MDFLTVKQIAQNEMAEKRSSPYNELGDKYTHGKRVAKLAIKMRRQIFPNEVDIDEVLIVAAWFHDICNNGGGRDGAKIHAENGAIMTRELLKDYCSEMELYRICDIIKIHDDRVAGAKSSNIALKIHQDADHVDHFGSLGIWRFICFNAGNNNSIDDALNYIRTNRAKDEARWLNELHFEFSRKIMKEKLAFERKYIERLIIESAGEIWNPPL